MGSKTATTGFLERHLAPLKRRHEENKWYTSTVSLVPCVFSGAASPNLPSENTPLSRGHAKLMLRPHAYTEFLFFRSAPQAARSILFFGAGEKGNRLKLSVNESKCEGAGRVSYGDEAATENHSRRMAHGPPRPARTPSSREQRSSFFISFSRGSSTTYYVNDFCRVGRVVLPSWETTRRNIKSTGTGVVAALQPVR